MDEGIEEIDGVTMYRIPDCSAMPPFLMTVVSSSDLWMFVSSAGGLTAGRVGREWSIFPYETDDRLHRTGDRIGPSTLLRIDDGDEVVTWAPFAASAETRHSLLKAVAGDALVFEAEHLGLGVVARARWAPADRFGWVRTVSLHRRGGAAPLSIEVVDGLRDVMPYGISVQLQQERSNLANAYRRSEIVEPGLGIYSLEASIVDLPEPAESLRATTVWSTGLPDPTVSLAPDVIDRVRRGDPFRASSLRTGRPGSYLVDATIELEPDGTHRWHVVADVAQSQADIVALRNVLQSGDDLVRLVDDDIRACSAELREIVAAADGVQHTASPVTDAHHFANTLFNVMRGGTFRSGYDIDSDRFRDFVAGRNSTVASRAADWLAQLPDVVSVDELRTAASGTGDADLVRLAAEYLPLSFSRRHGDPSRPWNRFSIRTHDEHGEPILNYEGNWRDIFQNWEALARSFPGFLPSMIATFLDASTIDGFNPYRITSDGIDWEIPDPEDPWSGIGYWGDHQIVYLHRLIRAAQAHDPGWLSGALGDESFSFANVPYRLASFDEIVANPKATVDYDDEEDARIAERVATLGADGRLLLDESGAVVHASMLEKLLVPALTKLSNYVPRGGIWMNTQRPEWNDANNALVGYGLSMVTLAHLRGYLATLAELIDRIDDDTPVSTDVADWMAAVTDVLDRHADVVGAAELDDATRGSILRGVGKAFDEYRGHIASRGRATAEPLDRAAVRRFLDVAGRHLDDSLQAARRDDGLVHSYNLIAFDDDGAAVTHLPVMLEGQVAAIGSGTLPPTAVIELVDAMYESPLYRADVDSFVLYPVRERPSFLDRNRIPEALVGSNPLLQALLAADDGSIITRDADDTCRFHADFQNVADLTAALDALGDDALGGLVERHRHDVLAAFEAVFHHHEFTGRSSTMYGYEGIGSVYWHMVAKLLVAIQEQVLALEPDDPVLPDLTARYERVRNGLGFNRSAREYGAFPTDPYSHTPGHAGAQQPGMTGQVKEELLTRWAELGLVVDDGRLRFDPRLVQAREFISAATTDVRPADYTVCEVPVEIRPADSPSLRIELADGGTEQIDGLTLGREHSAEVFGRTGRVERIRVDLPLAAP